MKGGAGLGLEQCIQNIYFTKYHDIEPSFPNDRVTLCNFSVSLARRDENRTEHRKTNFYKHLKRLFSLSDKHTIN